MEFGFLKNIKISFSTSCHLNSTKEEQQFYCLDFYFHLQNGSSYWVGLSLVYLKWISKFGVITPKKLLCHGVNLRSLLKWALEIFLSFSQIIIYSAYYKSLYFILKASSSPVCSLLCDVMLRWLNIWCDWANFWTSLLLALQTVQPSVHALKFKGTQESTSPNWEW